MQADQLAHAVTVISTFSAVFQHAAKAASRLRKKHARKHAPTPAGLERLRLAVSTGLSLVTNANLFALFSASASGDSLAPFYTQFMHPNALVESFVHSGWVSGATNLIGCLLMGIATGLGARFWRKLNELLVGRQPGQS